jgi:hypothetical protein
MLTTKPWLETGILISVLNSVEWKVIPEKGENLFARYHATVDSIVKSLVMNDIDMRSWKQYMQKKEKLKMYLCSQIYNIQLLHHNKSFFLLIKIIIHMGTLISLVLKLHAVLIPNQMDTESKQSSVITCTDDYK